MIEALEAQAADVLAYAEALHIELTLLANTGADLSLCREKLQATAHNIAAIARVLEGGYDLLAGPDGRDAAAVQRAIVAIGIARVRVDEGLTTAV